ncbi:MAG: HEPN domain-containing protein [Rhodospirillales bacterium]|nr:HEPN domain-containing protein [Rhodospirillales bacterium]
MTPIAEGLLARAELDLKHSRSIAAIGISDIAAREAYMAVFHAAQALVFERTGKTPKTHSGVRHVFGQIVVKEKLDEQLGRFLSRAYEYKTIADYDLTKRIAPGDVAPIVERAEWFVAAVKDAL